MKRIQISLASILVTTTLAALAVSHISLSLSKCDFKRNPAPLELSALPYIPNHHSAVRMGPHINNGTFHLAKQLQNFLADNSIAATVKSVHFSTHENAYKCELEQEGIYSDPTRTIKFVSIDRGVYCATIALPLEFDEPPEQKLIRLMVPVGTLEPYTAVRL